MGIFDGIGGAQYFESGVYVKPGLYKVSVNKVKQFTTRKKKPAFVVELKVLESSNLKDHPVGTDMTWMVMLDQDAALGNVKHFISVAGDTPIADVTAADAEDACGEGNPLEGVELRLTAVNVLTKAKTDFTKCKFMPATMSAADAASAHAEETAKSSETPAQASA